MFDPKEVTLKVSCCYLYGKCVCVISRTACDVICPSLFRTGWYVVNICIIAKFLMEINIHIFFRIKIKCPSPPAWPTALQLGLRPSGGEGQIKKIKVMKQNFHYI